MTDMANNDKRNIDIRGEQEQFLATEETGNAESGLQKPHYTPVELRKPFLMSYCILILIIFTLLQLIAAAYSGATSISYLIPRSAQEHCPVGATCAPAPGSWSNPTASPSSTKPPTAPAPGSYTNPISQSKGWGSGYYFVGGYLPTLTAILLSIYWKCVFARLKEMEPIYQLNKTAGNLPSAKDMMSLSYTSAALPKVFFSSLSSQHWLTWMGSVNMILVYICTAFASETVYISTTGSACHVIINPTTSTNNDCQMHLSLRRALGWVLGGVLFVIFLFTVCLIFRLRRHTSGIFAEVSSIVGVAGFHQTLLAKGLIGVHETRPDSDFKGGGNITIDPMFTAYDNLSAQQMPAKKPKQKHEHFSVHPVSLTLFCFYLIGVLVMILYYRFISKPGTNNPFEDFMDSQSFGIRLFMSCIGLAIKLYWGMIENHLRLIGPYVAMASEGGASADRSVLIRAASHPIIGLMYGSSWRQPLLGLVTINAVLSEVLVITLNTVPFSVSTAYLAFELSVYMSTAIIAIMIATMPFILIWKIRVKGTTMGRAPESIAEVIAMLDNDLHSSLGALKELDGIERDQIVRSWKYRYSLERKTRVNPGLVVEDFWRIIPSK